MLPTIDIGGALGADELRPPRRRATRPRELARCASSPQDLEPERGHPHLPRGHALHGREARPRAGDHPRAPARGRAARRPAAQRPAAAARRAARAARGSRGADVVFCGHVGLDGFEYISRHLGAAASSARRCASASGATPRPRCPPEREALIALALRALAGARRLGRRAGLGGPPEATGAWRGRTIPAMATTIPTPPIDEDKLDAFVGKAVGELGATLNAALVVIGDKLGLYRAMAGAGPLTPAELAERTGTRALRPRVAERPGRRRLRRVRRRAAAATRSARAGARARRRDSPAFLPGAFQLALRPRVRDEPRITEAFRTGAGIGWHEHDDDVFEGCERFFRPGYDAQPRPGLAARARRRRGEAARRGAHGRRHRLRPRRLDDPDGAGLPELDVRRLRLPRRARSRRARQRAARRRRRRPRALRGRAAPPSFPGTGYDLVTMFDCLHDMGDPVGAARHVRQALAPDGTWMIVEPIAGDRVEDNLNPVGRVYYGVLDAALHAGVAVAGGRPRARRPGRRGAPARGRHDARLHAASGAPPRPRSTSSSRREP